MNEADLKRNVVANIKQRGGYARRIEDAYSVGFPDLVLQTSEELPVFFCEAKIVRGLILAPSPRQLVEMRRLRISRYSWPILAGWKDGVWYLSLLEEQVPIVDCYMQPIGCDFFDTLEVFYAHVRQS